MRLFRAAPGVLPAIRIRLARVLRALRTPSRVPSLLAFVACVVAALASDAAPPAAPASRAAPAPERTLPARIASYTLTAKLDAARHSVHGKGHIAFLNASRAPLRELYFHLYLNAFKNEKSLYLRSPFGSGRSGARGSDWGYVDLKRLVARELGGADLLPGRRRGTPTDPDDETDIAVTLPRAIEPGERITLELEFESKLPNIVERTGYAGDFHFVAQ
jgi:hypothetical protein